MVFCLCILSAVSQFTPSPNKAFIMHSNGFRRRPLSIIAFPHWSRLYNVALNNVTVKTTNSGRGSGIFATQDKPTESPILIRVPKHLVLSVETIWEYAKSDEDLHEILTAVGDFGKVAMCYLVGSVC